MRKIVVSILLLSLSVLVLYSAIYLHSLDKTTVRTSVYNITITTTTTYNGPIFGTPGMKPCCTLQWPPPLTGTTVTHVTETTIVQPPSYASLWPYILALSIIILGLAVLIFRRNYCMSKVMILLISLILISLAVFLYSTDKPIVHILVLSKVTCNKNNYIQLAVVHTYNSADCPLCEPKPPVIYQTVIILPPPWYAQLWFLPLTVGILLIFMLAYMCKAVTLKVLKVIIKYLEPILN
ncbi:MAG: hypothetical protein RXR43_14815 [Sulfolobus sp.]